MLRLVTLSLVVAALAAGAAAVPAAGKDGVRATLATRVPLAADQGARLRVAWTLTYADEGGAGKPFGANGVFVRLVSASGAPAQTGFAPTGSHAGGRYAATVLVPRGGIGDVEIGLVGMSSGEGGTRRADMLFPITNDPLPGSAHVVSAPSGAAVSQPAGGGPATSTIVVGLASILAAGALAAAAVARRNSVRRAS